MENINMIQANGHKKKEIAINTEDFHRDRHTEDIQEIITKVPSWILRWGIMVFFGILLMLVAISIFVRYPDTIKGGFKLESSSISTPVMINTPGNIIGVFVKQGAMVKAGQPLALVQPLNINSSYTLTAPQEGKVGFVAIIQHGSVLKANQPAFIIHPVNECFFGIMEISPSQINKIKIGQAVLINLRNYPAEEYGHLNGKISYIADEPGSNGLLIKITIDDTQLKKQILLKNWMTGDAEIITQDVSILKRVGSNLFRFLN
jgi:multidrug resistance efflux pump